MRFIKFTLFVLFTSLFTGLQAQDIHWSLFQMSPLTLNPALTGAYEGTARIGGIFRGQSLTVNGFDGYKTPSFYADAPLINIGKRDWLGVGAVLVSDKAGEFSSNSFMGSVAYHKALDKKRKTVLTLGLQAGFAQKRIDKMGLQGTDDIINGTENLASEGGRVMDNTSYFDFNAGILLRSQMNKQTSIELGASFSHLFGSKYNLIKDNEMLMPGQSADSVATKLPLSFQLHGEFNFIMGKKWTLSPGFLYHKISAANETQVQALMKYKLNPEKETLLLFGPGYRLSDALQVLMGVEMKNLKVMASYDITLSSLNELNNSFGGFEIAAAYIIRIFKEPVVKPVIFCPRF